MTLGKCYFLTQDATHAHMRCFLSRVVSSQGNVIQKEGELSSLSWWVTGPVRSGPHVPENVSLKYDLLLGSA